MRDCHGNLEVFSAAKKCGRLRQAVRRGCSGGDGAGPVCVPAHRHHFGYPGRPAGGRLAGGDRRVCQGGVRSGHGHLHRLCPSGPAAGALFAGGGRLGGQCAGGRRWAAGRAGGERNGLRAGKAGLQGDAGGHPRHPPGHHPLRRGSFHAHRRPHRRARPCPGAAHHVGHRAAAVPDGDRRIGAGGHFSYPAHLLRRHLPRPEPHRPGGGRRRGGVLRPDGGLCGPLLSGKPLGRPGESGTGHLHAPDGQYRPQSPHLAARHSDLRRDRPHRHLPFPSGDERPRHFLGHGDLRSGRPDRRLLRLGGRRAGDHPA